MLSVVPVAMATEPENVEHVAIAEASPAFWMVVVAATLQAAVDCEVSLRSELHGTDLGEPVNASNPS